MSIFESGGPTLTFSKSEEYVAYWERCGKPPTLILEPTGGIEPETEGFLWQGFLVRFSKS